MARNLTERQQRFLDVLFAEANGSIANAKIINPFNIGLYVALFYLTISTNFIGELYSTKLNIIRNFMYK